MGCLLVYIAWGLAVMTITHQCLVVIVFESEAKRNDFSIVSSAFWIYPSLWNYVLADVFLIMIHAHYKCFSKSVCFQNKVYNDSFYPVTHLRVHPSTGFSLKSVLHVLHACKYLEVLRVENDVWDITHEQRERDADSMDVYHSFKASDWIMGFGTLRRAVGQMGRSHYDLRNLMNTRWHITRLSD